MDWKLLQKKIRSNKNSVSLVSSKIEKEKEKKKKAIELGLRQHLCQYPAVLLKPPWASVFGKHEKIELINFWHFFHFVMLLSI